MDCRVRRRWSLLTAATCLLLLAPVLVAQGVYRQGLAKLDELPEPPATDGLSERLVQLAWLEFEGSGPIGVESTGPLRLVTALALGERPNGRGPHGVARGFRLASICARSVISNRSEERLRMSEFHLGTASLAIWLGQNWSSEEIIACALNAGYYGQGRIGIESAASGYFGRSAAELAHDEIALLLVAQRNPGRLEPLCDPAQLAGDISELLILFQLESANAIPARSVTRRLSEHVWFSGRIRCVEPDDIGASG